MIKRIFALVMAGTLLFTCPVFAGVPTKSEAEAEMYSADAAIQGYKQALDTCIINEGNTKMELEWAERRLEDAKKEASAFVRPDGMDKKKAEGIKKNLKKEVEHAEEYMEYCKKLYKKAIDARSEAEHNLADAFRDYDNARAAFNIAKQENNS